jgi:phosphoribosylanthranilate isomerase
LFVKVCGTTTEADALLAVALGADALGFIFAPSRRQVAPVAVRDILRRLPPEILTVGVFRDEAPERVVEVVGVTGLRAAQLHGRETPDQTRYVRERVPVVFKAFAAGDPGVADAEQHGADAVLIDSATPGSGRVFDWSLAEDVPAHLRLVLAGGLDAGNVGAAVERVHPWGVDVATGVEAAPGHKDPRKLQAFLRAAREAAPRDHEGAEETPYDWREERA